MRVSIIDYKKPIRWQILNVIYFSITICTILPMIRGRSSPSYFAEINAPWWQYLILILIAIVTAILGFGNLFTDKAKIGDSIIDENKIEILIKNKRSITLIASEANSIQIERNHLKKTYEGKSNWMMKIGIESKLHEFDFVIDSTDESDLIKLSQKKFKKSLIIDTKNISKMADLWVGHFCLLGFGLYVLFH